MIRAKFRCLSATLHWNGEVNARLAPVTARPPGTSGPTDQQKAAGGHTSEENARFWKATPNGSAELNYRRPGVDPAPGAFFYIDMEPSDVEDGWVLRSIEQSEGHLAVQLNAPWTHDDAIPLRSGQRPWESTTPRYGRRSSRLAPAASGASPSRVAKGRAVMQGRRRPDTIEGELPGEIRPGDYWKVLNPDGTPLHVSHPGNLTGAVWYVVAPVGDADSWMLGRLGLHTVREEDDGTISVRPGDGSSNSILITQRPDRSWHGYIEHGVWRAC